MPVQLILTDQKIGKKKKKKLIKTDFVAMIQLFPSPRFGIREEYSLIFAII